MVIVSLDAVGVLPLRIVVLVTDWKETFSAAPWLVKISPSGANGLTKISAAIAAFQIRSVSVKRFVRRLGLVTAEQMGQILDAISAVIGIE